ncbi:MAG: FGGY-family carbohydrate kinase, partial [Hydrogenoanaerobacterium sp.]
VDGGACANNFLMQFQADIMNINVRRPMIRETTALGAAYLAGLAVGLWHDTDELVAHWTLDKLYEPKMDDKERKSLLKNWHRAVKRSMLWADDEAD